MVTQSGQVSRQGGLNKRPLEGRVKVPTRTRRTHFSAREMGPASESEEDGDNATLSIAGYFTGKCRDYGLGSRQVLTWRGGGTRKREQSHSPRLASPLPKNLPGVPKVSRGTRNTTKIIKIKIYTR